VCARAEGRPARSDELADGCVDEEAGKNDDDDDDDNMQSSSSTRS
jgi:hypothetical protein